MTMLQRLAGLTLLGLLTVSGPVYADAVTDWNAIAQPAIAAGRPGAPGALDSWLTPAFTWASTFAPPMK